MLILKQLRIILGNFKKDLLNNIIMIIFVTLSVFFMDLSLSEFMHCNYINNLIKDCGLYEDFLFVAPPMKWGGFDYEEKRNRVFEYIETELDNMKTQGTVESWSNLESLGKYSFYPSELLKSIRFNVSKGIWFDKYDFDGNSDSGLTPVVVGSHLAGQYKVGDVVTFDIIKGECVVIGVLERNSLVLAPFGNGTDMDLEMCFTLGDDRILLADGELLERYSRHYTAGIVVRASAENQRQVLDKFGDVSGAFTFKQMADNSYEQNRGLSEMQSIIFVLMMVVCIAGVSSANLLGTIASKKKYAVYFLCGMDWKTGVITTLTESVLKLAIPGAVGYAMFIHWCIGQDYELLRVTVANVILTVVFLAAIFLLTSLMPLLDIKRTSPVKIIVDT